MRFSLYIACLFALLFTIHEASAQSTVTISGIVKEASNSDPLPGITISQMEGKNEKPLGVSNIDGAFTITVPKGASIKFSDVTHDPVTRKFDESATDVEVLLKTKTNSMETVVVQGFSRRTKETTTGSITKIDGEQVRDVPVANALELLQGKAAGLNIQVNSGAPGAMGTINLRGISSANVSADGMLTPTSPLFVIDGNQVDLNTGYEYGFQSANVGVNPLSLIPAEDIESIEVLRDAMATSQYGAKAAYGVVIVTTKRGRSKVPRVEYSNNLFLNQSRRMRPVIGGKEERLIRINTILNYDTANIERSKSLINNIAFLSDSLNPYYNNATNWQGFYFRNTTNHTHNLNISGGDQTFNYKTNFNYFNQDGIIENTGFKRYGLNMGASYMPTQKFRLDVNLNTTLGQRQNGNGVGLIQTGLSSDANSSSLLPPPSLFSANNGALANAVVKDNNKTISISSRLNVEAEIVKGIRFQNDFTYALNTGTSDRFTPSYLLGGQSRSFSANDRRHSITNRTFLRFIKTLGGGTHNFASYVFNELNSDGSKASAIELNQTASDQISGPIGYNWTKSKGGVYDNLSERRGHSYGGAFSYNYDQKYMLDLSYRSEGTSTNGPLSGYTKIPAIAARWNFSKEKWFDWAKDWLNYANLRGSWGKNIRPTGNIFDVFGKYVYGPRFNNQPTVLIDFTSLPNEVFEPEITTTANFGIEVGLFNNRLELIFETYNRAIDNQIYDVELANINGFDKLKTNAISMVNYGYELTATIRAIKRPNFSWTIVTTPAINRDVITQLPGGVRQIERTTVDGIPFISRLGRSTFSNLLYYTQGVYTTNADVPVNPATGRPQQLGLNSGFYFRAGDPRWSDVNGDYVIDRNDLLPLGNPQPLITGGFNQEFTFFKDKLRLRVNSSFTLIRDILNVADASQLRNYNNPTALNAMLPIDKYNYWKPVNSNDLSVGVPGAKYANPYDFRRAGTLNPYRTEQTLFLEDGSYWKLQSINLSYNVDREVLKRWGLQSVRISGSVGNLMTISRYSGPDPELVTALGRDYSGGYPSARTYSIGLGVSF